MTITYEAESRVGLCPTLFAPKTGDTPPDVTITYPDGSTATGPTPHESDPVVDQHGAVKYPARWAVQLEPYWAAGVYRVRFGDVAEHVQTVLEHDGKLKPDEIRRMAQLPPDELAAAMSFLPQSPDGNG